MSVRHLEHLFAPRSVAVIGASNRPRSVGAVVLRNLLSSRFEGPILPVNPRHEALGSVLAYKDVPSLPVTPDIAVVCTPPDAVPPVLADLARRGTRAAIVLTAGVAPEVNGTRKFDDRCLEATQGSMRLVGPNSIGLMVPRIGLNASFAHLSPRPGKVAFVSQSGALCTAVLDWAEAHGIGFSCFVSLGNAADVDFGDILDYLGGDPATGAILMYVESITSARKFMSAARAAARNKPVLVIKAGRREEGARAATSHTGALAGADIVYDAAIRRAGMLRVGTIEELFSAVETLDRSRRFDSDQLAIVTNGGGPGVLAADAVSALGGSLSTLGEETRSRLDRVLPPTWSRANPLDIIGDADAERYAETLRILLNDEELDSVLVLYVPTAISRAEEAAAAVVDLWQGTRRNILTSWLGRKTVAKARQILSGAGIPTYETPEQAVRAHMHLVEYRRNQRALMEVPAAESDSPDREAAEAVVRRAVGEGRRVLTEPESKDVLEGYGIPVVRTLTARTPEEAAERAVELGFPVVLKVLSGDITHKSAVGGVALDLATAQAVTAAAGEMDEKIAERSPRAGRDGFSVQRMVSRPPTPELLAGAATDPVFGPVVMFGHGGTATERIADRAVEFPPLNMELARRMIARTLVGRELDEDERLETLCSVLVRISQLVIDVPEVREIDVNPLWIVSEGVLALDARIVASDSKEQSRTDLAIRPYPAHLEEEVALQSGVRLLVRPIRPEDEPAHHRLLAQLSAEDVRFRFFGLVREMPHDQMARYTQIDYDREMAFVATSGTGPDSETAAVVRAVYGPDNDSAEFGIVVRSDFKGQGLGRMLLEKLIRYSRDRGTREIVGQVLSANRAMRDLARALGFEEIVRGDEIVEVRLTLSAASGTRSSPGCPAGLQRRQ